MKIEYFSFAHESFATTLYLIRSSLPRYLCIKDNLFFIEYFLSVLHDGFVSLDKFFLIDTGFISNGTFRQCCLIALRQFESSDQKFFLWYLLYNGTRQSFRITIQYGSYLKTVIVIYLT